MPSRGVSVSAGSTDDSGRPPVGGCTTGILDTDGTSVEQNSSSMRATTSRAQPAPSTPCVDVLDLRGIPRDGTDGNAPTAPRPTRCGAAARRAEARVPRWWQEDRRAYVHRGRGQRAFFARLPTA